MHTSCFLHFFRVSALLLMGSVHLMAESKPESYLIESEYQPGRQRIVVLLPDQFEVPGENTEEKIRMLYVLPVEAGSLSKWGDPVKETIKADLHNRHQVICVFPEFGQLPWYADHPTEKSVRQESYLLKSVIPFIEEELSLPESRVERYLVGFSKSGWGAFSLLLRHPNTFKKAAAWDAPLMMERSGLYGSGPIFGTTENFRKYEIAGLLRVRARDLQSSPRLISMGYDNFRGHLLQFHKLATELKVPHVHRDGPQRKHHWESGWLSEAAELLLADSPNSAPEAGNRVRQASGTR